MKTGNLWIDLDETTAIRPEVKAYIIFDNFWIDLNEATAMRPEDKAQIYSVNKNLPANQIAWIWGVLDQLERTGRKKNGEVAEEKVNCKEKVGFIDWSCDKPFIETRGTYLYPELTCLTSKI